jgi:hypothetical protein
MNRDVFLSILAMDSYHRGSGVGLDLGSDQLGDAVYLGSDLQTQGAKDADFFASRYNWDGETIISYRGTDHPLDDAIFGWTNGAGVVAQTERVTHTDLCCLTPGTKGVQILH